MRKRVVVGVGMLAVLIAVGTVWWLRSSPDDRRAALERKRGARIDFRMPRQPETPATLSGLVTRKSDGRPIPHAVVSITWVGEIVAPDDMRPIVIITNADGQWATREVPPGDYVIAANAVGFAPTARDENDIQEGEQRAGLELALESGGVAVSGTIAAEDRNRVANARVTARVTGKPAAFVAMSDADGRYQLALAAGTYRIEVEHDDYQRIHRSIEVEQTPLTSDFVLIRGGVIRGRVIASDTKQPVADVIVQAMGRETFAASQSAEDGTFTLLSLGTGMVMVYARGRSHAAREPKMFELDVGQRIEGVQLIVDPAFSISGRVVAQGDPKQGIAGVKVSVLPSSAMWPLSTLSDGDGAFEVAGLSAGQQQLIAEKGTLLTSTPRAVEIVDKDVADVTIEMKTGVMLSGRVEPPTIAQVAIAKPGSWIGTEDENTINLVKAKTESDAAGTFTLRNIPTGTFEVTAMAKDGATGKLLVTATGADQSNLVVRLSPRSSISGRVVDTRGKPVANVYVSPNRNDVPMAKRFERDGIYRGATTAADGSFKLVGLEGGSWQLSVVEQRSSGGPKFEVDVDEGTHRTGVTLTIDARDAQIRGTVLGVDRKPAAGAQVRALQEVTENSRRRLAAEGDPVGTKQDGSFVIEKLRSGSYTLVVDGPGGTAKASTSGVKTGEAVAITLEPTGSLTIKVTQNGSPAKNVMLHCEGPPGRRHGIGAENVVGSHTFERLAPGEYRCQATVENAGASGTVTMRGQAAVLELALEGAEFGSLVGVVVSALDGAPIADAVIMAAGEGARTDANGRFVVDRVAAGDGVMLLQPKDDASYPPIKHSYTAKARERVDVGTIKILPPRKGDVGTFGLTLAVRDDVVAVTRVKPGSPAQQAGIKVGDTIASIDAHAVTTLGPERAIQLLMTDYVSIGDIRALVLGSGTRVTLTAVKW